MLRIYFKSLVSVLLILSLAILLSSLSATWPFRLLSFQSSPLLSGESLSVSCNLSASSLHAMSYLTNSSNFHSRGRRCLLSSSPTMNSDLLLLLPLPLATCDNILHTFDRMHLPFTCRRYCYFRCSHFTSVQMWQCARCFHFYTHPWMKSIFFSFFFFLSTQAKQCTLSHGKGDSSGWQFCWQNSFNYCNLWFIDMYTVSERVSSVFISRLTAETTSVSHFVLWYASWEAERERKKETSVVLRILVWIFLFFSFSQVVY